jgi:RNA polymerase sigma factor for flagellar operon FliA
MNASPEVDLLWLRLKVDGDPDARAAICARYVGLVRSLARRMRKRYPRAELDDLIGAGAVGLIEAVDRFEPGRGLQFTTYATARIRGALMDALRHQGPTTRGQRAVWRRLEAATVRVEQRLGERATPATIAAELRLPSTAYWRLRDALGPVRVAAATEFDHPPSTAALPIDAMIHEETRVAVREVIRRLPPKQRDVVTSYFYRAIRLREIGTTLGISESRVSQILRQAKEGIRRHLERRWADDLGTIPQQLTGAER